MMNYSSRPPEEPAVHAQDLTVVRGSRTVLRGLGFTVPRGRITGLLGPSGCGKSTLMRAVVGTQAKATGTLDVLGTPELLVLDEPTVGLDPVLRRDLWQLFHSLAEQRGATLLVSSHVMDEAERCHQLLLMRAGEVLAQDTPEALRTRTGADTVETAFLRLVDEAAATARTEESTR